MLLVVNNNVLDLEKFLFHNNSTMGMEDKFYKETTFDNLGEVTEVDINISNVFISFENDFLTVQKDDFLCLLDWLKETACTNI